MEKEYPSFDAMRQLYRIPGKHLIIDLRRCASAIQPSDMMSFISAVSLPNGGFLKISTNWRGTRRYPLFSENIDTRSYSSDVSLSPPVRMKVFSSVRGTPFSSKLILILCLVPSALSYAATRSFRYASWYSAQSGSAQISST